MDRFRNEFELTSDSITKGSTHTSKVEPKASLRETGNTVGTQTISVQIQNTDHAAMENCYFYVVNQQEKMCRPLTRRETDQYALPQGSFHGWNSE